MNATIRKLFSKSIRPKSQSRKSRSPTQTATYDTRQSRKSRSPTMSRGTRSRSRNSKSPMNSALREFTRQVESRNRKCKLTKSPFVDNYINCNTLITEAIQNINREISNIRKIKTLYPHKKYLSIRDLISYSEELYDEMKLFTIDVVENVLNAEQQTQFNDMVHKTHSSSTSHDYEVLNFCATILSFQLSAEKPSKKLKYITEECCENSFHRKCNTMNPSINIGANMVSLLGKIMDITKEFEQVVPDKVVL